MISLASNLSLYGNTPLTSAMELTVSIAKSFFDSKIYSDWKRSKENELKMQAAAVNRLNDVIRGLGAVAKVIAGRR